MFKKKVLDNGVRVVYEKITNLRSVTMGIWIAAGSRYENEFNNGISHFIEHMLFKGTNNRTSREIAESMESIGGQINAFTGREYTCYYAKVIDEHIDAAIDVLSDVFFNSVFAEKDINTEKSVIHEEISMYEDTPDDLVHDLLSKSVWSGSPLGLPILGNAKCLNNISRDSIRGFMEQNYLPNRIVFSIAGNFDEKSMLDEIEMKFGGGQFSTQAGNSVIPAQYKKSFKIKEKNTEQTHVCLGLQGVSHSDERLYSFLAVNNVFGGTVSSRLFQRVREELGMAYSVFSYLSSYVDNGLFTVYAGMNPLNTKDVISIILEEIVEMKKNGISEENLNRAKEQLKGNFILGLESTGSRMNSIGKSELILGYIRTPDEVLAKVDSISMDHATEIIDTFFKTDNISIAIVGKPVQNAEDIKKMV